MIAKTGDKDLYLIDNSKDELFNEEVLINPTVGGTHPSDLGHMEITKFYTKYLNDLLKKYKWVIKKEKVLATHCAIATIRAAPFYVGWSPAPVCTLQTLDMLKMTILTILKFTTLK